MAVDLVPATQGEAPVVGSALQVARPDDLEWLTCLGRGFFGEVWAARERSGAGRSYAVKKVSLELITENRLTEQLAREVGILQKLSHPRIVRLHFSFSDDRNMFIGMDLAGGGSLFDKLNKASKFSPDLASRYLHETLEALDYLHHLPEKIIHRDIKPENILLDEEDHVKLADFGWANMAQADKRQTFCGTLDYLPPEMIMGDGHDESCDMWCIGVLTFEMTTGQSPFGSNSKDTTCRLILNVNLRFPSDIDPDARDLVSALCRRKPTERLPVREALRHRFVTKFQTLPSGVAGDTAAPEADWGRSSVVARRLRAERERIQVEMKQLLEAKQMTEDKLMSISREVEDKHSAMQDEQLRRAKLEEANDQLTRGIQTREQESDELRKRAANLEADIAKLKSGGSWFGRRNSRLAS